MPASPVPAELFPGHAAMRDEVEAALAAAVPETDPPHADLPWLRDFAPFPIPGRLRAAMRHSLLAGGKRLRPALTLAAFDACRAAGDSFDRDPNGPFVVEPVWRENAMRAAVAVELVHTYSLIHDDLPCMDDDSLRRGRPTCHVAFDEATALLAGDALLTLAFQILSRLHPHISVGACIDELASAAGAAGMVGGQVEDLAAEGDPHSVGSGKQLEVIHRAKTGALIAAASALGGHVAGAPTAVVNALRSYGANLGLAFQIADDLLDLSASSAALGKTAGKDVAAGKLTYPALYGEKGSRRRAEDLIAQAIDGLEPLGAAADPLRALARYAVDRDR
ncbi:polyprenyl synthetase family protein [Alienimonas californiensis]|uniref:Farnesyl diphosphate synthase n=1 Tax=Alienimonas californiensis TaxID=2527989 RepID=A0A517PF92_9PLAN|nr:polyprenyl synthetase family protein [Alienimonas californiensis]QDT18050.1 Farnesyl diphosphate synthase [Alienimonas californiensis]